jgi:hypothetical protein
MPLQLPRRNLTLYQSINLYARVHAGAKAAGRAGQRDGRDQG